MSQTPTHIKDLLPDKRNARKHTPRNIGMIERSLQEVGAARSIVIDEENNILAGNGTIEAAASAGIERVRVVEADGNEIIAVKRTGLTNDQKKKLALYDNRTAELADWDAEELARLQLEDNDILDDLFLEDELLAIIGDEPTEGKEQTKNLRGFTRTHILISFDPARLVDIQHHIEAIADADGVELTQSST